MIGKLATVVLDTRDPHKLARFYTELLGAEIMDESADWVTIVDGDGFRISFQTSPEHEPPKFPDPAGSQQLHVDVRVDDIEEAQRKVLELGASRVSGAPEPNDFRVFRDPAGHTFCLVW